MQQSPNGALTVSPSLNTLKEFRYLIIARTPVLTPLREAVIALITCIERGGSDGQERTNLELDLLAKIKVLTDHVDGVNTSQEAHD